MNLVQSAVGNFGTTATITKAYGSNVTAGSLLVAIATASGVDTTAVSDNVNGSWTKGTTVNNGTTSAAGKCEIWYFANSGSGAITVSLTGTTSSDKHLHILELGGMVTATPLDTSGTANQSVAANGNASVTTSGSVSQANIINIMGTLSWNAGSQVFTAGTGFTHAVTTNNSGGGDSAGSEYEILTTGSGTQTGTQKLTTAETVALSCLAVFKGAAAGASAFDIPQLGMMGVGF